MNLSDWAARISVGLRSMNSISFLFLPPTPTCCKNCEGDLPTEESVRIIPFLRFIVIESIEPALFRFCRIDRTLEALEQWRRSGHIDIAQKTGKEKCYSPICAPEVGLLAGTKFPGDELTKEEFQIFCLGQHSVSDYFWAGDDQGQLSWIAIVHIGR